MWTRDDLARINIFVPDGMTMEHVELNGTRYASIDEMDVVEPLPFGAVVVTA